MKKITTIIIILLSLNLSLFSNEIHNKSKTQVKSKIFSSNNQIVKNQIIKNQIIKKRIQQRLMKTQTQQRDGCEEGFVDDCSGDGDCCPESWIGDGLPDCEDQPWGCDLTCYDNDGEDCYDDGGGDGGGDCDTIGGNEDWLGDAWCDDVNNNETCGFDNGDCCYSTCVSDTYDCEADSGPCVADICIDPNGNNDDCEDGGGDSCEDLGLVECDDGSCVGSLDECGGGGEDCEFFDCEGQEACGYEDWVGDGVCDDGTWGIYYNCEEFNNDEGDCDDDGGDSCEDLGLVTCDDGSCAESLSECNDGGGGDGCADGEFECNDGTCIVGSYENDGWCDCSQCEDDLGAGGCYEDADCCDCSLPGNCPDDCDDGGGGDCEFFDCEGQEACGYEGWLGDGLCDDGTWGIYYNCEEFNWDEGDCDDGGGGDGCADGEFECNDGTCIVGSYENDGWCDCSQCEDDLGAGGCYEDGDCCDCTFPENCPDDCDDGGGDGECPEGTVDDCSGDGDCCPENWIGDGYEDCEDQPYGCDLTCYDNDGGDCSDDGGGDDDSVVALIIGESSGTEGEMLGEGIQYGVQVPLYYESSASIGGIQFTIYDSPDWVTSTEVVSSENSCFESNSNDVEGSVIGVLFSLEGCELSASDTPVHFATIMYEFSADAEWGETVGLDFSQAIIADGVGNSLSVSTQGSSIDVSISGDISSDSEVNVIDVVNLINYILYIEEPSDYQFWAGDVNSDTVLNVLDVVILVDLILDR